MNNEQPETEVEPKKPGDMTDSIQRMIACLEDVYANAKAALEMSKNMNRDGMKWMMLSKAIGDIHARTRLGWQQIIDPASGTGGGAFFTKNEILDFVLSNPQIDIPPADEPIDPKAPKLVRGEQPWKAIESDSCGIRRANGTVRAWAIRENAGVEVFAKQHFVDGKPSSCWTFAGTVDCEKVIFGTIVGGRNKANQIVRFIRNGLLASRLSLKHKRMNRQAKAAAAAPSTKHEAPSTEEEAAQ